MELFPQTPEQIPEQENPIFPEELPERMKLIGRLNDQFISWESKNSPSHRNGDNRPLATIILQDCQILTEDNPYSQEMLQRRYEGGISISDYRKITEELNTLVPIAERAHDERLDSYVIKNPPYNEIFTTLLDAAQTKEVQPDFAQVLPHLKRLYVLRENLARLNGVDTFNSVAFNRIIEIIINDEPTLRRNPIY